MSGLNPWDSVWDPTLPMLPGAVATPEMIANYTRTVNTTTDVFERVIFAEVIPEVATPTEVAPPSEITTPTEISTPIDYSGWTKAQLYARAKELKIPGRSNMLKATLLREVSARTS